MDFRFCCTFVLGIFFCGLLGIAISFICIIIGFGIGGSKEEKLQKKYIKEIETILFSNPVFKTVIQIINSDSSIKRIHIYRDGIAFYEEQGEIPIIEEEKFSEGAWNYDSASEILEKHKQKWINENGTVLKCGTSKYLKYIDFGLDNSETAMKEFPKYIKLFANNDFSYSYPFKKKWLYWASIYESGTTVIRDGNSYTVGGGSKTLAASKKAYLAYVVVMGKKENSVDDKLTQKQLQKW